MRGNRKSQGTPSLRSPGRERSGLFGVISIQAMAAEPAQIRQAYGRSLGEYGRRKGHRNPTKLTSHENGRERRGLGRLITESDINRLSVRLGNHRVPDVGREVGVHC